MTHRIDGAWVGISYSVITNPDDVVIKKVRDNGASSKLSGVEIFRVEFDDGVRSAVKSMTEQEFRNELAQRREIFQQLGP